MIPSASLPALSRRRLPVVVGAIALLGGCATRGSWSRPTVPAEPRDAGVATTSREPVVLPAVIGEADRSYLAGRVLVMPVAGVHAGRLRSNFTEPRSGERVHRALDIMAPRGTPVLAADSGRIWKLRVGGLGGITIYATDPEQRLVYYYAHLDRYRSGLTEGMRIAAGDTLGFVGNTGNASATAPHLHFQISALAGDRRYWGGTAVDPLPFLQESEIVLASRTPASPPAEGALVADTALTDAVPLMTAVPAPAPPRARARPHDANPRRR